MMKYFAKEVQANIYFKRVWKDRERELLAIIAYYKQKQKEFEEFTNEIFKNESDKKFSAIFK